ncbi:MAG: hypothetical protein FWC80_07765 [Firmicutes bacterium]|nr:hypothetical protein [Bacillota bacterium]
MTQNKISFEDFVQSIINIRDKVFVQTLHDYALSNGCKPTFERKATSLLASYKHTKTKRVVFNFFLRSQGLFVRIYGENLDGYRDFLNTLPIEMVKSIENAGLCARLVNNGCSPKCTGYDFVIDSIHYQKCRYGGFEFLVTDISNPYIKTFVEKETSARASAVQAE